MTQDQAAVQAIARAISEGILVRCSCGQMETSGPDGRRRHEVLYGHRLSGSPQRQNQLGRRDDELNDSGHDQKSAHGLSSTGTAPGTSPSEVRP